MVWRGKNHLLRSVSRAASMWKGRTYEGASRRAGHLEYPSLSYLSNVRIETCLRIFVEI